MAKVNKKANAKLKKMSKAIVKKNNVKILMHVNINGNGEPRKKGWG